jgi:hypothetical protein
VNAREKLARRVDHRTSAFDPAPARGSGSRPSRPGRRPLIVPWVLIALIGTSAAHAQEDDPGLFEVSAARTELNAGVYYLDADVDLRLSSQSREAVASGLPISITFEVEFLNRLRLWWDLEEATLRQRYEIEYHRLTGSYIVRNVNTGDQRSFGTLDAALRFVGRIDRLPLIDAAVLDADRRYDVRLRALLDTEQLPGPLRLLAFWRRDWSLRSEWFTWRLDEE